MEELEPTMYAIMTEAPVKEVGEILVGMKYRKDDFRELDFIGNNVKLSLLETDEVTTSIYKDHLRTDSDYIESPKTEIRGDPFEQDLLDDPMGALEVIVNEDSEKQQEIGKEISEKLEDSANILERDIRQLKQKLVEKGYGAHLYGSFEGMTEDGKTHPYTAWTLK